LNLFVAGWSVTDADVTAALAALDNTARMFPQVDIGTRSVHRTRTTLVASVSHSARAAAPRRYTAVIGDDFVTYDGCPYDPTGVVVASDAASLHRHWSQLSDILEGQFVVVRCGPGPTLELLVDPLGLAQVFVTRLGGAWLVSNSARLLALASPECRTGDIVAADLYMMLGWTTSDRTWHEGVRVVSGGEQWTWSGAATAPQRTSYFSARAVARDAARRREPVDISALAAQLEAGLRTLDASFGPVVGTLSGGRDSRAVLALLLHAGIDARYYTLGADGSIDADIAREIATRVGLQHDVLTFDDRDIVPRWNELALQLAAQTDGMVAIREIARIARRANTLDRLEVEVWGAAGGIAKGNWMARRLYLDHNDRGHVAASIFSRLGDDYDGLVTRGARETARTFIQRYVDDAVASGVALLDVPALFSVEERIRRWEYGNARIYAPDRDIFSPFATRAWARAAFSVSPLRRFSSPLHYGLSKRLVPELHEIRYDKPWRPQTPWLNLFDRSMWTARLRSHMGRTRGRRERPVAGVGDWRRPERFAWLEAKRDEVRQLCLDNPGAAAWHAVDRTRFERIMAPGADVAERQRRANGILYFAAPFYYEESLRSSLASVTARR
jgi:hypothetical protein